MKLTDGGGHDGGIWFSQSEIEAHRTALAAAARQGRDVKQARGVAPQSGDAKQRNARKVKP